ncbi:MAG: hypothetical protein M1821_000768 [Bathelium mastoideum]|nr:MAG: hypothetical protein M1821_000768 [Bathelium mastoideum]
MPSVLITGLDSNSPVAQRYPEHEALKKQLLESERKVHEAGYDAKFVYVRPDIGVGPLKQALKEKEWDTVMLGAGVRLNPSMTEFWEEMVNAVHLGAPGKPLCFNSSPADILEAVQRICPN